MAKTFINETKGHIQAFEGFYESRWSPNDDIYWECEEEGIEEDVDFTFNYSEYKKDVCETYTKVWQDMLQEYIHEDIELEFTGISSPRYYNYETDKCEAIVKFTQEAKDAFMAKVQQHREKLTEWIKENHTSYDGFSSFLENDVNEWTEHRLFSDNEFYQPAYLFCMLHYIIKAELQACGFRFRTIDEYIMCDVMDDICITTYFEDIKEAA